MSATASVAVPRSSSRSARALAAALVATLATAALAPRPAVSSPAAARVAYAIDFASRTLDRVDLDTGTTQLAFALIGDVPNQVRISGDAAYVVNSVPAGLQIIDLSTGDSREVSLPDGSSPWAVEVAGERAYVSLFARDQVAIVDLVAEQVSGFIDVGRSPEGMVLGGGRLFVANSGFLPPLDYEAGSVSVIDLATLQVVATVGVGLNAQWCALDDGGELNVVCSGLFGLDQGQVYVVDATSLAVADSVQVGGFPGPIAIDSRGVAYMTDFSAGLLAIDTVSNQPLHDVSDPIDAGGFGALGLAIDSSDRVVVALSVDRLLSVVDPAGAIDDVFPVGPGPQDVDIDERMATPVTLGSFDAWRTARGIELHWVTTSESDHAGFHVERAGTDGVYARLTDRLLAGERSTTGRRYRFADPGPRGAVSYRLIAVDRSGNQERLGPFAVAATAPVATRVRLAPNPYQPRSGGVRLEFSLSDAGDVRARIVDVAGRPIRTLAARPLAAGSHTIEWDGMSDGGVRVASGLYFVQLAMPGAIVTEKITVVD